MTKKNQLKKIQKTKIDSSSSGGPNLSLLFSCYALAALQSPTINQDIRHKATTRSTISTLSSFNDDLMLKKENKRQRLGGSTYKGAGRVSNTTVSNHPSALGYSVDYSKQCDIVKELKRCPMEVTANSNLRNIFNREV